MTDKEEIDELPAKDECVSCASYERDEDLHTCGICKEGPMCVSCSYDHDLTHNERG